ncbi:hypothetical protein ACEWY4_022328 [Coilia grayii]|uniref:Uncharacterized protein n=1 Tax=Coilia grayii TaxID=363190 RepID=A0ABD1J7I2_9TELE
MFNSCVNCRAPLEPEDGHRECPSCLGVEHLRQGLTELACADCMCLSMAARTARLAMVGPLPDTPLVSGGQAAGTTTARLGVTTRSARAATGQHPVGLAQRVDKMSADLEEVKALLASLRPQPAQSGSARGHTPAAWQPECSPSPPQLSAASGARGLDVLSIQASESMDCGGSGTHDSTSPAGSRAASHDAAAASEAGRPSVQPALKAALARLGLDTSPVAQPQQNAFFRGSAQPSMLDVPPSAPYIEELQRCWADPSRQSHLPTDCRALAAMRDASAYGLQRMRPHWCSRPTRLYGRMPGAPDRSAAIVVDHHTLLLVAPRWPGRVWFPQLLQLLDGDPWCLPVRQDLLSQLGGPDLAPGSGQAAALATAPPCKRSTFTKPLPTKSPCVRLLSTHALFPMPSMLAPRTGVPLALALLAVVARAAVVTEDGYPIMWEKAPAELKDMPVVDGAVTINPWQYSQRMGMYRLLLNSTDRYMRSMGPGASDSALWGLPLQLGWKQKSGRLVDPTGASTCGQESDPLCISPNSWWACVNYHLSVIPFLAAVHTGIIGDADTKITVLAPTEGAENYCTSYSDCSTKNADLMSKWDTFFTTMKTASESEASDLEKRNQILSSMWAAQEASLQQATNSCSEWKKSYSSPEMAFSQSWVNAADFVGAAYFLSNLENSVRFMNPLPSRVLTEADEPPNISDLSTEENHALYTFSWMTSMNNILGGSLVRMWHAAMCSDTARERGRELLDNLLLNPKFAATGLVAILTEMQTNC